MFEGLFGMLAFFATILALVIGVISIGIALLTRHPGRAWQISIMLLGWIGLYVAALLAASLTSQPRHLDPGQERCFDEMCYSVTTVKITPTLGTAPDQLKARGVYYILTVQLRSASRRTAQKPSQPAVFVVDAQGVQYSKMLNAGDELGVPMSQPVSAAQLWDRQIQPGETVSRTVAFDLPAGIRQPGLVVTEGIGQLSIIIIGDENSFLHARMVFRLIP